MQRFLRFLNLLWSGRCWLTTLFFIVVVGFVDHNSFLNLFFLLQKNSELKEEIAYYEPKTAKPSACSTPRPRRWRRWRASISS